MAEFTYALDSTDPTLAAIAAVRLELGDTLYQMGVKPDGTNFSDAELTKWLTDESNDIDQTVARACQALARMWTNVANSTVGPRKEELGKVAGEWSKRASEAAPTGTSSSAADYRITVTPINRTQDPYQVRPEEDLGL